MKVKRSKFIFTTHLFLIKNNKILLARRKDTGYGNGNYGLISGHIDAGESATSAMSREAQEETGIKINPKDLQLVHILHKKETDERIDLFFTAKDWKGKPMINEPHLCDDMKWFSLNDLPSNTIPYVRKAIEDFQNGVIYAESGWIRPANSNRSS